MITPEFKVTTLSPIERFLHFQTDSFLLRVLINNFHITHVLGLQPTGTPIKLKGIASMLHDRKSEEANRKSYFMRTSYNLLLKKLTLSPNTISNPLKATLTLKVFNTKVTLFLTKER